ncbi:MAG: HD domain-containing protein, partial [Treponema sp.]|nr:HD domain-containing protein [Treponema sp.]
MEKTGVGFGEKLRGPELPERERLASLHEVLRLPEGGDGAAGILLDLRLDADTLAASLLHAVSRDREPPEAARALAGEPALVLLKGLAKIDSLKTAVKTSVEAENLRHMLFALTGDIRVIIIKLAEQLARLRAFDRAGGEERKLAARECLDIYAPVANQLGISWMKDEMEDLSLKFLNRETYQQIKDFVGRKKESRDAFLEAARRTITEAAERAGITIRVKGRAKHFYSVYMKMRKRGKGADEIRDLAGIRIICDGIENCYTLLGLVHSLWEPIDGFFKDYVARPKPNGYASLHTSVLIGEEGDDAEGQILEIQIRTGEMDRLAEYGVASHWLYKKGASRDAERGKQVGVVNKMKGWRGDSSDSWLADIKRDLFGKWIFVFTPQGKVIRLPAGATPLDFAFQVHTAVGERCIG